MTRILIGIFFLISSFPAFVHAQGNPLGDLDLLAKKLKTCEVFEQEFTHPFTRETLKRTINGFKDKKCHYVEEMPGKGKMECHYPREKLVDIADYYKNQTMFLRARAKSKTVFENGKPVTQTRHFIDGKEVRNPLQESLDNGECAVSGYGEK